VMAVYQSIRKQPPPPCFLLAVKGERFELGEGLSAAAERHLRAAEACVEELLAHPDPAGWRSRIGAALPGAEMKIKDPSVIW
jgi:hypothetical protein